MGWLLGLVGGSSPRGRGRLGCEVHTSRAAFRPRGQRRRKSAETHAEMERYDPGLKIIAQAQKERDADQYAEAHTHFVQGIEQLLQLLQTERDEKTEALVRKHVKRFLAEAEEMKEAQSQRGRRPQSQRVRMLQATAQGLETRARKAERELKYWIAKDAYLEAATSYRSIRQEVEDGCELHAWIEI